MLPEDTRLRIILAVRATATGYLALDLIKNHKFNSKPLIENIAEGANNLEINDSTSFSIQVEQTTYTVNIIHEADGYKVNFNGEHTGEILAPREYDDMRAITLLASQKYNFKLDDNNCLTPSVILQHNEQIWEIGGPGKLDLYRTHLITLSNILNHIQATKNPSSMLVALTTGSGKTFIQALWALTMKMADVDVIFSVPSAGSLKTQLLKDFKLLLPDSLINEIQCLEITNETSNLTTPKTSSTIYVATHEDLLEKICALQISNHI